MKFVNEIIRSLRAFMRKTGALLGTTFVLSLHAVFHNVICNWCNRAVQFLSIIILGCPLQPCPAHVYNTCACTVDRFRVYFHEFYEYSSKSKGFAWRCRGPAYHCVHDSFPSILAIRANSREYAGTRSRRRSVSCRRQEIRRDLRKISRFNRVAGITLYAGRGRVIGRIDFFFGSPIFSFRKSHGFRCGSSWLWGDRGD